MANKHSQPSPEREWRKDPERFRPGLSHGWQQLSCDLHERLLRRWQGELAPGSLVLKTDLFEESMDEHCPFRRIESLGWRPSGMDIGLKIAQEARRNLTESKSAAPSVLTGDVRALPFRDNSIDAVFSNSTLDHFATHEELDASIAALSKALKPGGRLMLTLDNPVNPLIWLRNAMPRKTTNTLKITRFYVGKTYGLRKARQKLREAGLEVIESGTFIHAPRYLAMRLLNMAGSLGMKRLESALLRVFKAMECLGALPAAQLTGHFIWIHARKPE